MPSVASSSSSRPASAASRRAQKSPVIGPSKYECAARSKVVSQKRRRLPLATTFDGNAHVDTTAKVTFPRTLARPEWVPDEVDTDSLCRVYPNLTGVPVEYVRDNLPLEELCAAIKDAHTFQPQNHDELPTELEIFMTDAVANNRPTHVLAVHNASPDSSADEKCAVSLFPIHELLFRVSCAHLPPLPGARLEPSFLWYTTVPVVPIRLPSVETFPLLRTYLYTQDAAKLFTSLAPPCELDLHQLAQHARKIHDFWSNACTLGVVDQRVYDVIEVSWERTIEAMQACSCAPDKNQRGTNEAIPMRKVEDNMGGRKKDEVASVAAHHPSSHGSQQSIQKRNHYRARLWSWAALREARLDRGHGSM